MFLRVNSQRCSFTTTPPVDENLGFTAQLGKKVACVEKEQEFCVLACAIHCIYDTHGTTLKSHNSMKITTTIDIPEETVLQAKYILLAHRNASEHRLLSSFYRGCLLALVNQCADGKLIRWPVEFVIQDRCDAHSWYAIAEKELNEK